MRIAILVGFAGLLVFLFGLVFDALMTGAFGEVLAAFGIGWFLGCLLVQGIEEAR